MRNRTLAAIGALAATAVVAGATLARRANERYESDDLGSAEKPGRWLAVDGVRLHVVEVGRGPALVLIHGFGASTFTFRRVIPDLARDFRVIAIDLKGFGYSERPPEGDYSLTEQARLVGRALEALGVERAAVVGHSMGGAVAMRLAIDYPDAVERLVLASSASDADIGRMAWPAALAGQALPLLAPLSYYRRGFRDRSIRLGFHDPSLCTPDVVEGYMRPGRIKGYLRSLTKTMAAWKDDPPLRPAAVRQPTLVLSAASDRLVPAYRGERLHRLIPDSRYLILPETGHLLFDENPEACVAAIREFLLTPVPAEEAASPA